MARRKYDWWEARPDSRLVSLSWVSTEGKTGEATHALGRFRTAAVLAASFNARAVAFLDDFGGTAYFYWAD